MRRKRLLTQRFARIPKCGAVRRLVGLAVACLQVSVAAHADCRWPLWERYAQQQISKDGRIVEPGKGDRTTSEAQAYAMFFAVVGDDRVRFDSLLNWALAHTWATTGHPPAWLWAKRADGTFDVLDDNSATDADLWMAYAMLEAARRWSEPRYRALGLRLLDQITATEVVWQDETSAFLIPGRLGFRLSEHAYLVNPSYAPIQLLRRFIKEQPHGPWVSVLNHQVDLLVASAPQGFVPDWYRFDTFKGYMLEPSKGPTGGFDAVRTYMWAGMLDPTDPARGEVIPALSGMADLVAQTGRMPLYVNIESGETFDEGSAGFRAAVIPLLFVTGHPSAASRLAQETKVMQQAREWDGLHYYDRNLLLFAAGWLEGRYRFDHEGTLQLKPCRP
ncbi:Cellulase [Paraburkholderia phymatum STM815]|uniref:Glucanase n=1 Tax=Paraburkholderia phymatum (strain DSM 17167 / CIP 108236 / LMG 21445 / STM815) TaxID=391038 RepID=B2JFS8_PARP8|nr:Cellulase [Paraburkholderia phymatum STM815]